MGPCVVCRKHPKVMLNVANNETLKHANFHENKIDKLPMLNGQVFREL